MWSFPLFPDRASTVALEVDAIYYFLVSISLFFGGIIVVGLVYSAIRYRKGSNSSRANAVNEHLGVELAWTFIPLAIAMGVFVWSSKVFIGMHVAPKDAMEVYIVGKQWMWKMQHPQGNREINMLHVPINKPVKLIMTSQDVIHSFYVPAFRIKQDVLPGRYTTQWFEATKTGEYHIFCAEYCGTSHSGMIGKVIALTPSDYEAWLAGASGGSMSSTGAQVFQQFGCQTCHKQESGQRGPALDGLFGSQVKLANGETIVADQEYIRESILTPATKVVSGYPVLMPTYRNQLTQEQLNQLVEYVKSLTPKRKQG
jgi:cytochrome c oxidase subunit 2